MGATKNRIILEMDKKEVIASMYMDLTNANSELETKVSEMKLGCRSKKKETKLYQKQNK